MYHILSYLVAGVGLIREKRDFSAVFWFNSMKVIARMPRPGSGGSHAARVGFIR